IVRSCGARGAILFYNQRGEELNLLATSGMPRDIEKKLQKEPPPAIGQGILGKLALATGPQVLAAPPLCELPPSLSEWLGREAPASLATVTIGRANPTLPTSVLLLVLPLAAVHGFNVERLDG